MFGRLGVRFGRLGVAKSGGAIATLDALTAFTWASGRTDTTPNFNVSLPGTALAGWTLHIVYDSGEYLSYVLQAADIVAGTITAIASADVVADGAYTFSARLENGTAFGPWSTAVVTVDTTNPTITTSATASVAENATLSIALAANESVTWAIRSTVQDATSLDASRFEISGTTLRWASNGTKDFETPNDSNTNNTYVVVVRATDLSSLTTDKTITVTVTDVNEAPTVANIIPDQSATDSSAYSFQFASNTFNDVDAGDTLTYTATKSDGSALPAWLTFTPATRTFSGTPAIGDIGTTSIKVTATDSGGLSVTDTFDLVVGAVGATSAWQLEATTDHWQLEDATGNWILE
jgi:hypothetical protein